MAFRLVLAALLLTSASAFFRRCPGPEEDLKSLVDTAGRVLIKKALPTWLESVDDVNGGYIVGQTTDGIVPSGAKTIVSQSRLVWSFSNAHIRGYSSPGRDYLAAAKLGYDFIQKHLHDTVNGGYYWSVDGAGAVLDNRKYLQGQLFVLNALAEYFKASEDSSAMEAALSLVRVVSEHARDDITEVGGFYEDFMEDWTLLASGSGPLGAHGRKNSNTILHLAGSLSRLLLIKKDDLVRSLLEKVVDKDSLLFFPPTPEDSVLQVSFGGDAQGAFPSESYGRLVEWAWIKAESEQALDRVPNWDIFDAYARYSFEKGLEPTSGGLMDAGTLAWWPQTEVMKMVETEITLRNFSKYERELESVLRFYLCDLVDIRTGLPVWSANPDGSRRDIRLKHAWKAGFHITRGIGSLAAESEHFANQERPSCVLT